MSAGCVSNSRQRSPSFREAKQQDLQSAHKERICLVLAGAECEAFLGRRSEVKSSFQPAGQAPGGPPVMSACSFVLSTPSASSLSLQRQQDEHDVDTGSSARQLRKAASHRSIQQQQQQQQREPMTGSRPTGESDETEKPNLAAEADADSEESTTPPAGRPETTTATSTTTTMQCPNQEAPSSAISGPAASTFYSSIPVDVKDPLSRARPLRAFDRSTFEASFPSSPTSSSISTSTNSSSLPPFSSSSSSVSSSSASSSSDSATPTPQSESEDPFLYPFLAQNERKRLHEFWYLTSGMHEDTTLATHLSSLLAAVRDLYGFDTALLQLIDADRTSSLTPDGWASTCYPRRETGCSFTMLLQPGTVLAVSDFSTDPRFAQNPQIASAQMKSYAGVPLAYEIQGSGESVSLGSLCVLSFVNTKPPLSKIQQESLTRFAGLAMHAIKDRTRLRREATQTLRHELLSILSRIAGPPSAVVEATLSTLKSTFGGAKASFVESKDKNIPLQGVGPVHITDFQGGIWENASVIEEFIKYHNHESSIDYNPECTVGAIAVPLTNVSDHYLVIESSHLRDIFDGSDVLFVQSCAMVIASSIQDGLLRQALEAKTDFLRNVQHAFRTSLNGILSATDMLLGEGAAYINGSDDQNQRRITKALPATTTPLELLRIIETSGRGLLTVINHLIDLDAQNAIAIMELCDMHDLEEEVLDSIVQYSSKEKMRDILLISDSHLSCSTGDCIITDRLLLRQAIAALVQNAVEATSGGGMIMVKFSLTGQEGVDACLDIEVRDTGIGIALPDQERIFQPFEKVNVFTPNAGLGLTFACQYAATLGGTIELVESVVNEGSVFRLRLPEVILASSLAMHKTQKSLPKDWTYWMNQTYDRHGCERIYGNTLQSMGISHAASPLQASIVVQPMTQLPVSVPTQESLGPNQIQLMLGWEEDYHAKTARAEEESRTVYGRLPWTRSRLIATLMQAKKLTVKAFGLPAVQTPPLEGLKALNLAPPIQSSIRALLVDDNAMNLNILQAYCKKRHFDYSSARDGREAFAAYVTACEAGQAPSICLLDLQMPVMDGLNCAKMMRAYEERENRTRCPIIMVTAQSGDMDRRSSIEAGTDAYYVKPLRISTLDDIMARYARV